MDDVFPFGGSLENEGDGFFVVLEIYYCLFAILVLYDSGAATVELQNWWVEMCVCVCVFKQRGGGLKG